MGSKYEAPQGAYWDKRRKVYAVVVKSAGRKYFIGRFKTAEEAELAYLEARERLPRLPSVRKTRPKPITDPVYLLTRFWEKVDKSGECWLWMGKRNDGGYGIYRERRAHRYIYEATFGKLSSGQMVCHHCDNPPCVRPEHLFVGTCQDNMRDMTRKGRSQKGTRHWNARLSDEVVAEIRSRYVPRKVGIKKLAAIYGLSPQYVQRLIKGEKRA